MDQIEQTQAVAPIVTKSKRKYYLAISAAVLVVAIIVILTLTLLLSPKEANEASNNQTEQDPVSATVANTSKKFTFENESSFNIRSFKDFKNSDCSAPQLNINVDATEYSYKENLDLTAVISRNLQQYSNQDEDASASFSILKLILTDKIDLSSSELNKRYNLWSLFNRHCGGIQDLPIGYLEKVNYPGSESAYVIIQHGSTQSATNRSFLPVYISVVAKVGDEYLSSMLSTQLQYPNIVKENNLASCEVLGEGKDKYFDINDPKCINEQLVKDLDKSKLDSIVADWLEVFKLK